MMSERQHSQGEWRHDYHGPNAVSYIMAGKVAICTMNSTCDGVDNEARNDEALQNGEIMAAAPEMLRILKAIDTEARDSVYPGSVEGNGDAVIPSHIFDLVQQQLKSLGLKQAI